ncbi:putative beta-galactanase protein [Coleophoma crateriformis]|uniref:Putative beta-galactanase protein n=1 Tax=Coleophoma crateriformis TaxID=565419 RepID=A0A3D8SNI6_9HELO|nr:putative beta-galactanase protein [Coleophoma crateriformis]
MLFTRLVSILAAVSFVLAADWPNGPFVNDGRWIVDASNNSVIYAGVNWPGAAETMLPEGLQYQSIEFIVAKIKAMGMNVIRLTYATQMIDEIYDNGGEGIPIATALVSALGQENGTSIFQRILANNPTFSENITHLEVFDAIASECAKNEIYVHLDNHVSKAMWCCAYNDGNGFFHDTHFDVGNWTRGLSYMANHGLSWPNLMSMSLRNELRPTLDSLVATTLYYNWGTWYTNVKLGADAINAANPKVLIFLSGLLSDTYLTPAVDEAWLLPSFSTFNKHDFAAPNKLVWELHNYDLISAEAVTCSELQTILHLAGFSTLTSDNEKTALPMVMTEWGFDQDDTTYEGVYATCLVDYLPAQQVGWMIWVIGGSHYIREGTQDSDETYGMLNHEWSDWRSPVFIEEALIPMVNKSLSNA